jgi:hypothetical protein
MTINNSKRQSKKDNIKLADQEPQKEQKPERGPGFGDTKNDGAGIDIIPTADYKINQDGKKYKAHRIVFSNGHDDGKKGVSEMKKTLAQFVEELKGGQVKLDKNKNGKLDAEDFKKLRSKSKMEEEVEELDEVDQLNSRHQVVLNRTPSGKAREILRNREHLKSQMKTTKSMGGLAGPKGKLPEEFELGEAINDNLHPAVFSGTGANGVKYKIIHHGDDFKIHANGKHIDSYGSLHRAMSVLKNEVPGLKQGVAEGRVAQLPTRGADYSKYDTDHLKMMLRPGKLPEEFELDEAIHADDYTATSEKSAMTGGHRPHVVNKETGKTMMLGQHSYKSPEHATAHAKAYLSGYAKLGMHAADRAGIDYAKANKQHMVQKESKMNEELHPAAGKVLKHIKPEHHAKYTPDMTTKHYTDTAEDRLAVLRAAKKAGHLKEEMNEDLHPEAGKVLKHIKPEHHAKYTPNLAKGTYKGDYADRSAVLKAAERAGHLKEASVFDWKNSPKETKDKNKTSTYHDVKKISTGTVYTKQFDKDGTSKGTGGDAAAKAENAPKRGRGRPKKDKFAESVEILMSLSEEQFDSMMEEGFDAFFEAYEQLDELSKMTLGSYVKSAAKDAEEAGRDQEYHGHKNDYARGEKRQKGIAKAVDRLTK